MGLKDGEGLTNRRQEDERDATETLTSARAEEEESPESLRRGATVGRYIILGWIGSGGMGRVYAAYDPDLDRRIALKLVRPAVRSRNGGARLLREAQAMAKLAHPNVVAVYDVGQHRDQIFLAMELVDGRSLRHWMRQGSHGWREVLEIFCPAGRGLEAAHTAGLVHRDFKPSNVLLAADGRVRIADLGLARLIDPRWASATATGAGTGSSRPAGRSEGLLAARLTRTETPVGSPAYMAPEQYARGEADARSDQFSFCVALFEALYGVHPFRGSGDGPGGQHRVAARRIDAPESARVPRRVRAVVERGLALDPDRRYPSMAALLQDLGRELGHRGRSLLASAAIVVAVLLGLLVWQTTAAHRLEAGRLAEQRLAGIWDEEQKQQLQAEIEASGSPLADETWPYLEPRLDAYVVEWSTSWIAARDAVRLAGQEAAGQEAAGQEAAGLPYRRLVCLDQRLVELRALTRLFASGDPEIVAGAVLAAQKLPDLSACSRVEATGSVPEPEDPETRRRLEKVRDELAEARALESAEVPARGLPLAREALSEAQSLDFPPVTAQAHWILGRLQLSTEDLESAAHHLEESLWATLAVGQVEDAIAIAADLNDQARQQARRDQQRRWLRLAAALNRRLGSPPALRAKLEFQRGRLLHDSARYEEASAELRAALASARQAHGPAHEAVAEVLFGLGATSFALTRYAEAVEFFEQAREMREQIFGPRHPKVAEALNGLGGALRRRGRDADAIEVLERALDIRRRSLGAEHSAVGVTLNNLANVYGDRSDFARAIELLRQAESIFRQAFGADHPRVATCLFNLGRLSYQQGRLAVASDYLDRAVAVTEAAEGPDHPSVAAIVMFRSSIYRDQGDLRRAGDDLERAHQIYQQAHGPRSRKIALVWAYRARLESASSNLQGALDGQLRAARLLQDVVDGDDEPEVATLWRVYADYLLEAGRHQEAVAVGERALATRARVSSDAAILAPFRWTLARARLMTGGDRQSAVALARQAREAFATIDNGKLRRDEIDAWLAEHAKEPG